MLGAAETNRLTRAVEQQSRVTGGPGVGITEGEGPPVIQDVRRAGFWAKLGASTGAAYAWTEQVELSTGTFEDGQQSGTVTALPAYEVNGVAGVASGTVVWVWPSDAADGYLFECPSAPGPSFDAVTNVCPMQIVHIVGEIPSGTVNSSNKDFVLAHTPLPGGEAVYVTSSTATRRALRTTDYTIATATITFGTAPTTGSTVTVDYYAATGTGITLVDHLTVEQRTVVLTLGAEVFPPACTEDPTDCCPGESGSGSSPTCCDGVTLPSAACLSFLASSWLPLAGLTVDLTKTGDDPPTYEGSTTVYTPGCADESSTTLHVLLYCYELTGVAVGWVAFLKIDLPGGQSVESVIGTAGGMSVGGIPSQNAADMTCDPFTFLSNASAYWVGSVLDPAPGVCHPCTIEDVSLFGCTPDTFMVSVVSGTCGGSSGSGGGGSASRASLGAATGSPTATLSATAVAGSLLIVVCGGHGASPSCTFAGAAMDGSRQRTDADTATITTIFWKTVAATTTGNIEVTWPFADGAFCAVEVLGLASNLEDQHSTGAAAVAGNPDTGATGTTATASEYAQAGFCYRDGTGGAAGGGFTAGQSINFTVGGHTFTVRETYQVLSATGTPDATITGTSPQPDHWSAILETFK